MTRPSLETLLGIACPILQAPIGSLATPQLAAAVSNAGGMGSLALTWNEPQEAARRVAATRALTRGAFFGNFVLSFECAALPAALDAGLPAVTFSWGLPGVLVRRAQASGARVGVQVATAEGARRALDEGCDFLICQGVEAGGHVQSSLPLLALLAEVRSLAARVPVVAAGGLTDAADVAVAMRAGADGAMLGTRFVASTESAAHPLYKQALLDAGEGATAMTGCFDGGWPYALHRVLRNSTLRAWEAAGCPPVGQRPGEGDAVGTLRGATLIRRYDDMPPIEGIEGDPLACCLYAGEGVARIHALRPAGELVETIWGEARRVLSAA